MLKISYNWIFDFVIFSFDFVNFERINAQTYRITTIWELYATIDSSICSIYRFREVSLPTSVDVDVAAIIFITLKKRVGRGRKIEAFLHIVKISIKRLRIQIP